MPSWRKMVLHGSSGSLAHLKLENLTSQSVLGTDASGNVVAGSVSGYSLPTATASVLGGVKVGGTLTISSGILNAKAYIGASAAGVGEVTEGGAGGDGVAGYVPAATSAQYLSFLRGDGTWQTPTNTVTRLRQSGGTLVAGDFTFAGSGATSISFASGVFTISSTDTDTNTTYTAGTGLTLTGTTFSVTANTFAAAGHSHAIRDITGLQTALDEKQVASSYAASSHTHDDRYLRLTETSSFFDRVIDSAPGTLDTLNELAAAIGDDANFSASIAGVLARKADSNHGHSNATTSAAGFMSTTDKSKLDGVADNANNFSLPTATASVLGGVKIGTNLSISSGVLSATDTNTVTRVGTSGDDLRAGDIQFRGSGATSITFADGTVTISSTDTDTDTNTTYTAGTGLTLTGTTFSVSANTFAAASHVHTIANVTGLQTALDGKQASGNYAAASHTHAIRDITDLQTALDSKQASLGFTPYNATNPSGFITSTSNISGNAATATNSSQLNGLSKVQLWNNSGQNHPTYQSFGAIPNFGIWFMQNPAAGDSPQTNSQYYVQTQGLGNDYGYGATPGNYGLMTAIARDHARKYTYFRTLENGAWGAWSKGAAGYADEAGNVAYSGLTGTIPTWNQNTTGNAATSSTFSTGQTNYKGVTDNSVAGQLMWKNYGNNHTIFDASNSTSPSGGAVNNANSAIAWTGTYPTLMGWNGNQTYGVRVDSSRVADSAGAVAWDNVSGKPATFSPSTHTHSIRDITDLQTSLDGKQASLGFTPYNATNPSGFITGISYDNVSGKPSTFTPSAHTHAIRDITDLQTSLDGKLSTSGKAADSETVDGVDSSRIIFGDGARGSTGTGNMNDPNQKSGFHFQYNPTGAPYTEWWNWITVAGNSWQSSNNYQFQLAHDFHSDNFQVRRMTNGSVASWRTIIDSGNIGGQSVNFASSAGAVAWDNVSSKPTTFAPSTHTHSIRDITDLQTSLDGKQASLGFTPYNATNPSGFITGLSFANVSSKPTTLGGYGITDAVTTSQTVFSDLKINFSSGAGGGHSFSSNHYSMGLDSGDGSWVGPHYRDLIIGYHTGIRIGAHYSGVRFYNDSPTTDADRNGNGDRGENLLMTVGGYVGTANHTDVVVSNNLIANSSLRAPIFYDSNDTAFYLNPAGGSRLRNLYVGDSGDDWSDPGGWGTQVRFSNGPHVKFVLHARTPGIEAGMYVHTPGSVFIGSYTAHNVNIMVGGNSRLRIEDGRVYSHVYMEAASSMRAPIFYDSEDTNYFLNPNSNSYLSTLRVADASSGVALHVGNGSTYGVYTLDNARKYLVVSGEFYPHMALVATGANNANHGAVFSFVGSESGRARQWNLGTSNNDPFLFSIGYNATGDDNPHYGVGDGWAGDDSYHARLIIDRSGNTKIRGMLYVNGTSGGMTTGNAVIHAGNIGSQSVNYATSAGSATSATTATSAGTLTANASISGLNFGGVLALVDSGASTGNSTGARMSESYGPYWNLGDGRTWHFQIVNGSLLVGISAGGTNYGSGNIRASGELYARTDSLVLHAGNFGSYALPLSGGTVTGTANFTAGVYPVNIYSYGNTAAVSAQGLQVYSGGGQGAIMAFHRGGYYAVNFGLDDDNVMRLGGWSAAANRMQLDMSGNVTFAGNVTGYSDARIKTNVKTIDNALEKVKSLRGVSFTRTDSDDRSINIGVIAQEVLEILPEVVSKDASGMYNVAYGNMAGLFIEAIKQQQSLIEQQQKQIDHLKTLVDGLTK